MKSICLFMSVVMFLCMGIPAQAAEKEEVCENAVYSIGLDEMNVGDTKILRQDEDGTLSVTLVSIEIKEEFAREAKAETARALYEFKDTNWLGVAVLQFEVGVVCKWINDGENSKITDFSCEYTNFQEGTYKLEWNQKESTPLTCTWWLKATKNVTDVKYIAFSAFCRCWGAEAASPYILFDCY